VGQDQSRITDIGEVSADAHGCPACPHSCKGPIIQGSPNVMVNGLPASRKGDMGVHAACCGPNIWFAKGCSGTVKINGLGAHRKDDSQTHCGGTGQMTSGSGDVSTGG
jgi:uncharacterized Zn-binding protein involved in type VI secretion